MRMIFAVAVVAAAAGATAHATANTTFVSKMYGYSIVLPGDWVSRPASVRWTGGPPVSTSREIDLYVRAADGRDVRVAAVTIPRSSTLRGWTRSFVDTVPAAVGCTTAGVLRPSALGGAPALRFEGRCASAAEDFLMAATVRRGRAYLFALVSPSSYSGASDRRVFETVRRSFRFVR
jgi:hypothetical protein